MTLSDSMFLFDIVIKDFKSYTDCKDFNIIVQFADIFKVYLKKPTAIPSSQKFRTRKVKNKHKIKISAAGMDTHTDQSILIINKPSVLLSLMKKYPLEIYISKKNVPDQKLASTTIPWNKVYINYLIKGKKSEFSPAYTEEVCDICNELTSIRIATVYMSIKLTHLKNKTTSKFMPISIYKPDTFAYKKVNSISTFALKTLKNCNKHKSDFKKNYNSSRINECIKLSLKAFNKEENLLDAGQICSRIFSTESFTILKNTRKSQHFDSIKSDSNLIKETNENDILANFCSSDDCKQKNFLYRYIFGDSKGPFGNRVYHVGYFTVEKDFSGQSSTKSTSDVQSSEKSTQGRLQLKLKKCDSECLNKKKTSNYSDSVYSLDLPEEADKLRITKCKKVDCEFKRHKEPSSPDDRILLDLRSLKTDCCVSGTKATEKIEEVEGGVIAKLKIGQDPCFCTCECTFGFIKKTTYCAVCGGYEIAGEDLGVKTAQQMTIPCPIFHKLVDKNKLKTWSTSGSESKKRGDDQKSMKTSSGQKATTPEKRLIDNEKKNFESEKGKKKKRDDKFKFNYGYKAPQIGHSKCALPCSGTLENVPKGMGWLWTAEDIPGMKFRPMWKPGATNKHVVRLLRIARNPGEIISKKKRKDTGKKKRPLKRPLLVVHKTDGEYNVTMETMKAYSKPRALNQHPYEDKPVVTYTIGRTDEENRERLKKKERANRRLERAQRHFIQSAFRDMCHEICLKTYQQALGILPSAEDPDCTCYPALPSSKTTNMDISCSCSEDKSSLRSDTDSDEWIVEFTPPNAIFDPTYKGKKVFKVDNGSQYTYLDYRVKLVDRFGNSVPRFFKGPDGKQECSDLGGFWNPDHKWLEINVDGYVAPDGRWAPNNFIGPSGEQVDAETGKFQAMNGNWLVVGVDGFIDSQGKWKYYPKSTNLITKRRRAATEGKQGRSSNKKLEKTAYKSETSWSCFGDVSPKQLSKLGIVGHGEDKKLLISTLKEMLAHGQDVKIPKPATVFYQPDSKHGRKERKRRANLKFSPSFQEGYKCHHPIPSDKGIVAVDDHGNKTYFRLKDHHNKRPKERLAILTEQGISLSSFHVPCLQSFINSEIMKQQQRDRIFALSTKSIATQV